MIRKCLCFVCACCFDASGHSAAEPCIWPSSATGCARLENKGEREATFTRLIVVCLLLFVGFRRVPAPLLSQAATHPCRTQCVRICFELFALLLQCSWTQCVRIRLELFALLPQRLVWVFVLGTCPRRFVSSLLWVFCLASIPLRSITKTLFEMAIVRVSLIIRCSHIVCIYPYVWPQ